MAVCGARETWAMDKDKWIFYTDLFGGQRWERLSAEGMTVMECASSFPSLDEAVADARRSGFTAGGCCGAGVLEWRCRPAVMDPEDSEA